MLVFNVTMYYLCDLRCDVCKCFHLLARRKTLYDSRGSKISKGSVLASSSHQSTKDGTAFSDSLLELGERHNEVSQGTNF